MRMMQIPSEQLSIPSIQFSSVLVEESGSLWISRVRVSADWCRGINRHKNALLCIKLLIIIIPPFFGIPPKYSLSFLLFMPYSSISYFHISAYLLLFRQDPSLWPPPHHKERERERAGVKGERQYFFEPVPACWNYSPTLSWHTRILIFLYRRSASAWAIVAPPYDTPSPTWHMAKRERFPSSQTPLYIKTAPVMMSHAARVPPRGGEERLHTSIEYIS